MKCALVLGVVFALVASGFCEIRVQGLDRKINLQSQFVKVTQSIKLKNTGEAAASTFDVCALSSLAVREAFFKVTEGKPKKQLKFDSATTTPSEGVTCRTVSFAAPLEPGASASVEAYSVYTKVQVPKPAEIKQDEKQFMVFLENLYVLSPYQVSQQNTEVLLPSSQILFYTKNKSNLQSGTTLKFGRYDSIKPFSLEEMRVHYESSKQFVQVLTLDKEVQVSHWGNIYVEETYELKNAGASHIGQFSRLRYSQQFQRSGNAFRDLTARLPQNAHSLYYKDLIGNISTSNVRKTPTSTLVNFELRYPLLGGWKVDFFLGWSVPLEKSLFQQGWGKLQLHTNFGSSVDGVQVDELNLKVVLPEGSTYLGDNLPFDVQRNFTTKCTYLDTTGRPVLVFHKLNVVPDHNVQFEINYAFNQLSLLREPLLLISAFAAFFATVIFINRLDLTISKDEQWKEGQKQEQIGTVMLSLYKLFTDVSASVDKLSKLASSARDASASDSVTAEKVATDGRLKSVQAQIEALLLSLRTISPKLAGQVEEEVERKAAALKEKAAAKLASKLDMLKKNAAAADILKKMGDYDSQLESAEKEYQAALDRLFGQY